jgi:uncharacterized protein with NRDE domain
MCLLALAFNQHPNAPLIVASNRDEFYARPTLPMHWWEDAPILAGRDQQANGTWMGLSRNGRFAAVTNYRYVPEGGAIETAPLSRGDLVTEFLCSSTGASQWAQTIASTAKNFGGFNLLIYDGSELVYLNNHDNEQAKILPPGLYALSNGALDSPWPKVEHARDQLRIVIDQPEMSSAQLGQIMATISLEKTYAPELLPNTGVPENWEKLLSSPFIVADGYGTRASAAVIISATGDIDVAEQNYQAGEALGGQTFRFNASER